MTPAGDGNVTLTIPAPHFHAALATAFPDIPETILARGAAMRVGPGEQTRLRTLLDRCEAMIWQPGDAPVDPLVRHNLERELLEAFLAALRSGCNDLVPPAAPRLAARHRRLREARDFLAAHTHKPIYLDDLCTALGLSHRGVQNLFQDLLGLNPITYLNHQRLHGARRSLLHAPPGPGTVKRAAYDWGFLHQGRFARDYLYALRRRTRRDPRPPLNRTVAVEHVATSPTVPCIPVEIPRPEFAIAGVTAMPLPDHFGNRSWHWRRMDQSAP